MYWLRFVNRGGYMNFYFEKIILHNFASYTHSEIDLTEKGFCLVSGRNLYKKDNSYSNGSGKSSP